jgi:hypothetical protein
MPQRWPLADQQEMIARRRGSSPTNDETTELHPAQRQVVSEQRRFNAVDCGRRFGKTLLGMNRAKQTLRRGLPVGWFAPTYKLVIDVWQEMTRSLHNQIARRSAVDKRLELTNGAVFEMWTLDNPDAGRSRKYARVIIDEAAMVKSLMLAWNASIRPTLTDYRGDAWFLSTPKGRNGFWEMYLKGLDDKEPDWACWKMPTASNPYIDLAEIEDARRQSPERYFQQEYLAEFLADGDGVFRKVMEAATAEEQYARLGDHQYVLGVDWGKVNDFTVITVIDTTLRSLVCIDRFNQIDYTVQLGRLEAIYKRFSPVGVVVEYNSMGIPLVETLVRMGLPVIAFQTTNASKAAIIDALSLAFERNEITILNDPVLIGELLAYDMERLPSGLLRYGAPEGFHDDCVMSLAFAWSEVYQPAVEPGYVVHEHPVEISPY